MAGLVGLNDVRAKVQAAGGTRNKAWKDSIWSDLIKDVVSFLVSEGRDHDDTAATAVGLIMYGVTTKGELQNVPQLRRRPREPGRSPRRSCTC